MFVPLIPAPFHNFACVRFIFLLRCVGEESYIVVHVEIEQWSGFSARFVDDEVVECVML
jgi:DMSO/TMAO reductase YedYZ molybdopterin-dependent catalytic subunit